MAATPVAFAIMGFTTTGIAAGMSLHDLTKIEGS
jgi:hypothetical protein